MSPDIFFIINYKNMCVFPSKHLTGFRAYSLLFSIHKKSTEETVYHVPNPRTKINWGGSVSSHVTNPRALELSQLVSNRSFLEEKNTYFKFQANFCKNHGHFHEFFVRRSQLEILKINKLFDKIIFHNEIKLLKNFY